jgi:hypothetical protein
MEGANGCSSAIPIQIAAVAVQVAMFIPQSSSLLPCPRIIAEVDIAPYFAVVAGNPYLIPPDIVPIPPIAIARKHRSRTHTDHQQDSGNHTFHILSLRLQCFLLSGETTSTGCKPARGAQVVRRPQEYSFFDERPSANTRNRATLKIFGPRLPVITLVKKGNLLSPAIQASGRIF